MVGLLEQGEAFTPLRTDTINLLSEVFSEASITHEFGTGFTASWRHRRVGMRANNLNPETGLPIERLITTEATGALRFAKGERFVGGEFVRRSLGTEWLVLDATVTWPCQRAGSQYNYTRCTLEAFDEVRLGWWGRMEWPPLQAFRYGAFPLMKSSRKRDIFHDGGGIQHAAPVRAGTDEWVSANVEWHGEGIFNHLPLLRRLELREVGVASPATGTHATKHCWNCRKKPQDSTGPTRMQRRLENTLVFCALMGAWRTDLPWPIRHGEFDLASR